MNIIGIYVNIIYSIIGILLGICGMMVGYKLLDKLTSFNTSEELKNGNQAVGCSVAGLFMGIGICSGLVVGLALN